jgi:hypothetical protein
MNVRRSTFTLRSQRGGFGHFAHVALVITRREDGHGRSVSEQYDAPGQNAFGANMHPFPADWREGLLRGLRAGMAFVNDPKDLTIEVVEALGTYCDTTPTDMAYAACMAFLTAFKADTPDIVQWLDRLLDESLDLPHDHVPSSGPMK